jgi:hypothetical protein
MAGEAAERFLKAAEAVLPPAEGGLLELLHRFTGRRLQAVRRGRSAVLGLAGEEPDRAAEELHVWLGQAWEALDGLAREVNAAMYHLYPESGLYPPLEMTRQCTFYMVRKKLHAGARIAEHPVSRLLWSTRRSPGEPYRRLSFLYNLSLFVPLPLPEGRLPGTEDLPGPVLEAIKPQEVAGCPLEAGLAEMGEWLEQFAGRCYEELCAALG